MSIGEQIKQEAEAFLSRGSTQNLLKMLPQALVQICPCLYISYILALCQFFALFAIQKTPIDFYNCLQMIHLTHQALLQTAFFKLCVRNTHNKSTCFEVKCEPLYVDFGNSLCAFIFNAKPIGVETS